jgi:hypothetical protein
MVLPKIQNEEHDADQTMRRLDTTMTMEWKSIHAHHTLHIRGQ